MCWFGKREIVCISEIESFLVPFISQTLLQNPERCSEIFQTISKHLKLSHLISKDGQTKCVSISFLVKFLTPYISLPSQKVVWALKLVFPCLFKFQFALLDYLQLNEISEVFVWVLQWFVQTLQWFVRIPLCFVRVLLYGVVFVRGRWIREEGDGGA